MRSKRDGSALTARWICSQWPDRYCIKNRKIVFRNEIRWRKYVQDCVWQPGASKNSTGYLPTVYQKIGPVSPHRALNRDLPNVASVERVAYVVVRRTVSSAQVVWVLRIYREGLSGPV